MINDAGALNDTGMVPCTINSDKPNRKAAVKRLLGVVVSYIAGYLFVKTVGYEYVYLFNIALVLLVIVWNECIMIRQKEENIYALSRSGLTETRFWEGVLLAIALIGNETYDWGLNVFFEVCIVTYMSMCATGHLLREETSVYLVIDAFKGMVSKPFAAMGSRVQAISYFCRYLRTNKKDKNGEDTSVNVYAYVAGVLMVLIAIPVFLVVLSILTDVDSNFSNWVNNIFEGIFDALMKMSFPLSLGEIIFSIPCGLYIHSVFEGKLNSSSCIERDNEKELNRNIKEKHIVPFGFIIGIVFVFLITYIIFIAFQANNLFSVFRGIVPGTLTAANYAREGFFELCRVMVINLGIMASISVFSYRDVYESKAMKATGITFMAVSLLFSVISVSKLCLYINRFGYTSARFISLWAATVLGGSCIAIIINLITEKKTAKIWLMSSAVLYILMNIFTIVMY